MLERDEKEGREKERRVLGREGGREEEKVDREKKRQALGREGEKDKGRKRGG